MSKPRTGAPKRVAVGLLAGALAVFGVALAPPAGAAATVTTERLSGATRYGTASAISAASAFGTPTMAIVATGETFPDALAASSLAGANASAPIILTETGTYNNETKSGLAGLKAKGVVNVTIVGGTLAVSPTVEAAITADGFTVTRVAGTDRYETAAAIATAANAKSPAAAIGGLKPGLFATGNGFADALTGGPAAYANKIPLLLVSDTVPASTQSAIASIGIKKAYVLGGTAAVSSAVEAQLVLATGNPVTRLAGVDRNATAAAIGDFAITTLGFPATSAILATGAQASGGADALAAGPLGGQLRAPIVLTATLPEASRAFLDKHSDKIQKLWVAGGTAAIDDATVAAAKAAAETVSNDGGAAVTTRPELTGAAIVSTTTAVQVTPGNPAGTKVRYTFDEVLGTAFTPVANRFKVYTSTNTAIVGTTAAIETGTGTSGATVLVNFATLDTAASTANLSVATVLFEAVRDAGNAGNPEGDAPIGTAGTTPTAAGATAAPDLVSVGGYRQASSVGQTAIDFTFDQATQVQTTTALHVVDVNGNDVACTAPANGSTTTGGGTVPGGNGTTTITVVCTNAGGTVGTVAGTAYSASNVARGYVLAGGVGTSVAGANPNPLQAADVAGSSLDPDLVSVSYNAATGAALFTFDVAITQATGSAMQLFRSSGAQVAGGAATINPTNATQVSVVFAAGQTDFVGGNVTNTGGTVVTAAASTLDGRFNDPDEEGFAGSSTTLTPGRTTGPDLTSVTLSATTDAFGNVNGYQADYAFDVAAGTTMTGIVPGSFHLYFADGTRWNGNTCTAGTGAAGAAALGSVRCTAFVNHLTAQAPAATAPTTLAASVLGTVEQNAVSNSGGNPEGANVTTGGTGTPAS